MCVCERVPSGCGSPHHTHSRQLPTTPSHSRARIRTPPACCNTVRIPFHAAMATTGQCQTRAVGRVAAPRRRGHCPPPHSPTHRGGVCVCVCVNECRVAVALLTTLTPANSQPLPHILAPEYARHPPANTAASHFMPPWPPQGSVKQGLSSGWRLRGGADSAHHHTHQHTGGGACVCVCERVPSGCGSPHHTHSRQLPTTPSHSRARIRTSPACQHRCIPFHAVMATTGQCQTRAVGRVAAPRRRGHCPPPHSPTHRGGGVCVCVCV